MFQHNRQKCPCYKSIKKQIEIFIPLLKKLSSAKTPRARKALFNEAPICFTKFISHCASAILRGDIELPSKTYAKLKKFKNLLLRLSDRKIRVNDKTASFLKTKGGAFPFIPILTSILANVALPYILNKVRDG